MALPGNLENQNAKSNTDKGGLAHEISEENKDQWELGHMHDILANNLASLCLCPKNLS